MTKKLIIFFWAIIVCVTYAGAQSSRYAAHSVLSKGKWAKIRVSEEGVYQITPGLLKTLGFNKPENVRLYGYNRPFLPEANIQDIEDDLVEIPLYRTSAGTKLLFYSKGVTLWKRKSSTTNSFTHQNNPYSKYVYYFLTENTNEVPAKFREVDATGTTTKVQNTFYAHSLIENDAFSFLNCGRTFFDSYDYATGSTNYYKVNLPGLGLDGTDIKLDVKFGAAGSKSSTLTVNAANKDLGTLYFYALEDYQYADVKEKSFTISDYKRDTNSSTSTEILSVKLSHQRSSGISGHLDYIRASYETSLNMFTYPNNYIAFGANTPGDVTFDIAGIASDITVWNVSSPSETYELKGKYNGENTPTENGGTSIKKHYSVSVTGAKLNDLFVALNPNSSFPTPEKVGMVENQDLHSLSDINLLIIVPSNGILTAQAQRLADAHTTIDGIKCQVVKADKVYNEFSSGTPDATAYRRLMKMLYDKAEENGGTYPENLLLFGACLWDNKFVTTGMNKKSADDYLLCYESDNSWSHTQSWVLEEYFTLLDDGEGVSPLREKPDAGVGRIPVNTAAEGKKVVDKLISYMQNKNAGAWKNTICFLADDGNNNQHMSDAEIVSKGTIEMNPKFNYKRIYWDSYKRVQSGTGNGYPDAYAEINRTMNEGALIMNYTGHGAPHCLSHEQVLKTKDFKEWSSPNVPLWITAACDVAPFDMNTENIAVEAVLNPNGGAIGFIGTARTVYSTPNRHLNNAFMKYVLGSSNGQRYTIGEALAMAKCDLVYSSDTINKCHFVLLGDPALRLPKPTYTVVIDNLNGKDVTSSDAQQISAGDIVTINGHIEDEDGSVANDFTGVISPTIFDNEETIICNNNDGSANVKFTYKDYKRKLYEGADSIRNGKFSFTFPMPMDNNYSNKNGLINLHAINNNRTIEANGRFTDFIIGGTSTEIAADTIGPEIKTFVNTLNTIDGQKVNETPTIYVHLADSSGINACGNGLGHDILAIIDGKESMTYNLNNYFKQTMGDYTHGQIEYTFPGLESGEHTLKIRAFDIYNNMSEMTYSFIVYEGLEKFTEIYDFAGRLVSDSEKVILSKGIYVKKTIYRANGEEITSSSEKYYSR